MEPKIILIIISLSSGLLAMGLSIPLINGKIPPNYFYGLRVKKTLSNKEIWYKANSHLGKDLLKAGLIVFIFAVVLLVFQAKLPLAIILLVVPSYTIIAFSICIARALWYLSKL